MENGNWQISPTPAVDPYLFSAARRATFSAPRRRKGLLGYDQNKPNHKKISSVIFAPFTEPGGAVPAQHFTGLGELRKFLEELLHIRKTSVGEALAELVRKGTTSIFNVQLTNREAKKLKLA